MDSELHGWIQLTLGAGIFVPTAWRLLKTPTLMDAGLMILSAGFVLTGIALLKNVHDDYEPVTLILTAAGFLITFVAWHREDRRAGKGGSAHSAEPKT